MAKAIIPKSVFDGLSDEMKGEYKPREGHEGQYLLIVDEVDGFALEDVAGLRNTLGKFKKDKTELSNQLKQYDDIDPDEARAAIAAANDPESAPSQKQKDVIEREKQKLIEQHTKELKSVQDLNGNLQAQLDQQLMQGAIQGAFKKHGVTDDDIMGAYMQQFVRIETVGEGESQRRVVVVTDAKGETRIGNNQGDGMTVDQLVAEMSKQDRFAPYFKGSGASGGGASGGGNNNQGPVKNTQGVIEIKDSDAEGLARHADDIASGKAVVVASESSFTFGEGSGNSDE